MRNRAQWRAALAKERRWLDTFVPTPPALRARDLIRGEAYFAVWRHRPGCMLFAGWQCRCRPDVKFYAVARGEKEDDLDYAA
jgi:hypothetical protein